MKRCLAELENSGEAPDELSDIPRKSDVKTGGKTTEKYSIFREFYKLKFMRTVKLIIAEIKQSRFKALTDSDSPPTDRVGILKRL